VCSQNIFLTNTVSKLNVSLCFGILFSVDKIKLSRRETEDTISQPDFLVPIQSQDKLSVRFRKLKTCV